VLKVVSKRWGTVDDGRSNDRRPREGLAPAEYL